MRMWWLKIEGGFVSAGSERVSALLRISISTTLENNGKQRFAFWYRSLSAFVSVHGVLSISWVLNCCRGASSCTNNTQLQEAVG